MELAQVEREVLEKERREGSGLLKEAMEVSRGVKDPETYQKAADLLLSVKQKRKAFLLWFKPIKQRVDDLKRLILDQERSVDEPFERAEMQYLKPAIVRWETEQEGIRRLEQERIQAQMRKDEEDRRLAHAAELESNGRKEEAETVLETPIATAPVVIQAQKTAGLAFKTIWKARIINPSLIPREFLIVDEKKIGQVVRAMQDKTSIPGVEIYSERAVAASSR